MCKMVVHTHRIMRGLFSVFGVISLICFVASCSSEKFLDEGETILSNVKVVSADNRVKASKYRAFVRQNPNAKWFSLVKVPLGIYCMSKADSVKGNKGFSKILRNIGEAPVVYDDAQTQAGRAAIVQALNSEGYLHAEVDTLLQKDGHKTKVTYNLRPGTRYYISNLGRAVDDEKMAEVLNKDAANSYLRQGMPLNLNRLADERGRVVKYLHEKGYYFINKDFISYDIDTIKGELGAAVTLRFAKPVGTDSLRAYELQRFRNVNIYGADGSAAAGPVYADSSINYRGLNFYYDDNLKLKKSLFVSQINIFADSLYHESQIQNTYSRLNALPFINFTTIQVRPVEGYTDRLDCDVRLQTAKRHSIGLELEGTNTAGDLGVAAALNYSNRNLFHSSEQFNFKVRGAYEAITGLEGYNNENYVELSTEMGLRFPTLIIPFVNLDRRHHLNASSDVKLMYDMQDRPEFHRRVLTASWTYNWNKTTSSKWQHRYDLLSVNYIFMPWISDTFRKDYLEGDDPHYSVLRYSYENLFILKTGYGFSYNSIREATGYSAGLYQTNGYQVKFNIEFAGNLLYLISRLTSGQRNSEDSYSIFNIAYSQYAKIDFDFSKSLVLNERNSVAFHTAFGLGLPYGNSTILPYEKRYFSGGANSVRGWSVRELGPGAYTGKDGKIDFINQTGNLKLDLSIEWRTFLFWKLHGAFFVDAGNIWNTRRYADQEEGQFKWNTFYKQIAVAYGLGLRLNFDYFILRLDGGMKAVNPAVTHGRAHYPIINPSMKRDFSLHFAVGLPF